MEEEKMSTKLTLKQQFKQIDLERSERLAPIFSELKTLYDENKKQMFSEIDFTRYEELLKEVEKIIDDYRIAYYEIDDTVSLRYKRPSSKLRKDCNAFFKYLNGPVKLKIRELKENKKVDLLTVQTPEEKEEIKEKFIYEKYKTISDTYQREYQIRRQYNVRENFKNWFLSLFGIVVNKDYVPRKETVDKTGREILLEVDDVSVHFRIGRKVIRACNHLNFKVYRGETFGIVGESGSGKTTITRAVIGINKVTGGNIFFKGKNISHNLKGKEAKKVKKGIQMIFQDPAASLNERANVDYIISEGLYNFKLYKNKEDRLNKVVDLINAVGLLPEHLSRYPHEFSGGQRQRIGIARALAVEPELILADEPISALDVSIRAQVLNLLNKLQKERNLTYVFIAHDLSIMKYISTRVAVMHQGYIVELGNSEDIYENPVHPYTQSLLLAIPQPDPKSKDDRKRVPYDMTNIDYRRSEWIEVKENHFVLGKKDQVEEWKARSFGNEK